MSEPIAELGGRTWEELEVRQHESGRLMFPDRLRRRNAKGEVVETRVCVRIPTPGDEIRARTDARIWFAKLQGLDADRDKGLFDQMEQICLLARAIRTPEAPHPQLVTYEELAEYEEATLQDLLERINVYKTLLDPREAITDEETFWRKVIAIGKQANLLPLADIVGREQPSFIVRMAKEACRSPTARSYVRSSENSTPER